MSYFNTSQIAVTPRPPAQEKTLEMSPGKEKCLRTQTAQSRTFNCTRKEKMDFRIEAIQTDLEDEARLLQRAREELHSTRREQQGEINTRPMQLDTASSLVYHTLKD